MKRTLCLLAIGLIVVWSGSVLAESVEVIYEITLSGSQYKITEPGGSPANSASRFISLANGNCKNIVFANSTPAQITVRNTTSPTGHGAKPNAVIPSGGTLLGMTFCCPADGSDETWVIEIGDGAGGNTDAILDVQVNCEVPTLSEWGMIIFSLLILTLATVVVVRRKTTAVVAGANVSTTVPMPLMVAGVFWKVLAVAEAVAIAGLAIAGAVSGSLAARDIVGTLISAAIVAYMAHLWIGPKRE